MQFFHVHWSRGTLPAHDQSDLEGKVLTSNKTNFAVESFQVRKPEREVIYRYNAICDMYISMAQVLGLA